MGTRTVIIDQNKTVKKADVSKEIQYSDLFAYKQDIKDWVDSRLLAISRTLPDWTNYIRVCNDIMVDAHVSSIVTTIKNKIKLKEWVLCNADGTENEDAKDFIDKKWLYDFMDYVVEAIFFPYSLIFLGDMKDWNLQLKMIDREYVTPQYELIKKSLYISSNDANAGWKYTDPKLSPYYIFVPSERKLGLLDIAASHALGKKHMLIYWWRYAEKYGIPFAKGKTDIKDNERRTNMEAMLSQMGNSPWGVFDTEDDVEFEQVGNIDAFKVFKEELVYSNNEISKGFAGALGIFDEKSFVGSAEAGERIFDDYIQAYCVNVVNVINEELIPRLINTYKFPLPAGCYFKFVTREKISYKDRLEAFRILAPLYNISPEEVMNHLGIEVETKEQSVIKEVGNQMMNFKKYPVNPLPTPSPGQSEADFIASCMSTLAGEYPDQDQRYAICKQLYKNKK